MTWLSTALLLAAAAHAAADDADHERLRAWAEATFLGLPPGPPPPPSPGLDCRRQDYGKLRLRRSVMDTPLRLGGQFFEHGLGTHCVSEIVVHLPAPGARFTAQVGVDNNYDTAGVRGCVTFAVEVGGKEAWHSDARRGSSAPLPVDLDLAGATEFTLRVGEGGEGPGWGQSDWADAAVVLADGKKLWLDDLPVAAKPATWDTRAPFSFSYDGKSSRDVLAGWTCRRERQGEALVMTYADPVTGLEVECRGRLYADTGAIDWVLHLTNRGTANTPIIEHLLPLDLAVAAPANGEVKLHHAHGSTCGPTDFLPLVDTLAAGQETRFAPAGGRSSNGAMPFFNAEWQGGGLVGGIGWSGQWEFHARHEQGGGLMLQAGQQTTHFRLHPGESVRTPSILLVPWSGEDRFAGHNGLRRTLLAHYVPRGADGQPALPPITNNGWFTYHEGNETTEANQKAAIATMAPLGVEDFWLDAGWFEGGWPAGAGSWVPRADHFPAGLRPLGEAARAKGMGFVLWFEPERVNPASRIAKEHPEWVLKVGDGDGLFNLGDPAGRAWLTDFLARHLSEWGVTIYRNDFNIDPLPFWTQADAPERRGMAEIRYVEGLYALWDELPRRVPGLLIDNCASGGRRIDIETVRRSYPLWHSDTQCCGHAEPIQDQAQTAGLSVWVPLHGAGAWGFDPYTWRSVATTGAALCPDLEKVDAAPVKAALAETKALRPLWLGDFYPLLDIDVDPRQWCAWQLHRADLDEGCACFFRRPASPYAAVEVALHGLRRAGSYRVTRADDGHVEVLSGADLAHLRVAIDAAPGSVLLRYTPLPR
jgi:alpha-galactosidase